MQIDLQWGDGPVAALLRDRGAGDIDQAPDRNASAPNLLDEMMILAVQRGDLAAVRELLARAPALTATPIAGRAHWGRHAGVGRS